MVYALGRTLIPDRKWLLSFVILNTSIGIKSFSKTMLLKIVFVFKIR